MSWQEVVAKLQTEEGAEQRNYGFLHDCEVGIKMIGLPVTSPLLLPKLRSTLVDEARKREGKVAPAIRD